MNFRDELSDIGRDSRQVSDDREGLYASARAHREQASRAIQERLRELADFLNQYRDLGRQMVAFDMKKEKRFSPMPITPLGMSWKLGRYTITEQAELYGFRDVATQPGSWPRSLKKYAASVGIGPSGSIGYVRDVDRPLSHAVRDLTLIVDHDWQWGAVVEGSRKEWKTPHYPGQVDRHSFGVFPDGTPAIVSYCYNDNDGKYWTAGELEPFLKRGVEALLKQRV